MSVFNSIHNTSDKAIEKGEEFLKNSEQYYTLKLFQILTSSLSLIFRVATIAIFMLIAFIFLAVALSAAVSDYFENPILGPVSVGILFIVFAFVAYLLRNRIENLVIKSLSKKYFSDENTI